MTNAVKKIVIIGATSLIAENCARLWVNEDSVHLVLVGRNRSKTERVAADLQIRSPGSTIQVLETDFSNPKKISQLADSIFKAGPVDMLFVAHGVLPDQEKSQNALALCEYSLHINGISPVLFAEAFAVHLQKQNSGSLIMMSSVAGDRGRKSNYVYGSAKAMITRYCQGLQHRFAGTDIRVVLVKPGPTRTPMTEHMDQAGGRFANAEDVARTIVRGIKRGKLVIYAPIKWQWIMMVVRHLPRRIFNMLNI